MGDGPTEAGGAPRLVTGLATSIITRTAGRIPGVAWKLEPCLCPGARGRLDRPVAVDAPGYGAVGASADRALCGDARARDRLRRGDDDDTSAALETEGVVEHLAFPESNGQRRRHLARGWPS